MECIGNIAIFRTSEKSLQRAVQSVTAAITKAREANTRKLLVVVSGLSTDEPPTLGERHAMVREWAEAAQGRITIAMVAPPEFIDRERFGVIAAANFGLVSNVFDSEGPAMDWLEG